ncbi:MAG: 50S ribosomal protein L25 [Thermomicrobiales bacterium]
MDNLVLRAVPRTVLGKKVKVLRRQGLLPGVVYGPVLAETVSVCVDARAFTKFYQTHGQSTLIHLQLDSGEHQVFIREVQTDPVRGNAIHIDFFAPNLRQELNASVPVSLSSVAVDAEGVLSTARTEVEVRGLPANIPSQVEADLSGLLTVGDSLRVSDLVLPAGLTMITDETEVIASLVAEAAPEPVEDEVVEGEDAAAATESDGTDPSNDDVTVVESSEA